MNILITGATGLVGTALTQTLSREGHNIYCLLRPGNVKRDPPSKQVFDIPWTAGHPEIGALPGGSTGHEVDAVINLAGAPVASERWTDKRKMLLRSSRVDITRGLVNAIAKMNKPPGVLISASAIGYYGACDERGDELLTESTPAGQGFLAELAQEWEAEALKATALGVRVVLARFGIILAKQGGALPQMMAPFKFGLGAKLGTGRQWTSWISLEDVIGIIHSALTDASLTGPVNVVSPAPVTNAELTRVLAQVMHRPAIFAAPAAALRLALGEMADGALLASQRVAPRALQQHGYKFLHSDLRAALTAILH
jgi:uncharacterized protein (TIGR01777 family)